MEFNGRFRQPCVSDGFDGRRGTAGEIRWTAHPRLDAAAERGVFDPLVLQGEVALRTAPVTISRRAG